MTSPIQLATTQTDKPMCATCDAWDRVNKNSGRCRAKPPTAHVLVIPVEGLQGPQMSAQVLTVWPEAKENDFCMEHSEYYAETRADDVPPPAVELQQ